MPDGPSRRSNAPDGPVLFACSFGHPKGRPTCHLLLEAQHALRARRKKKRRNPTQPKWSSLDKPLATAHPNQVLTFREWCALNNISERTGRRILVSGTGPVSHTAVGASGRHHRRQQCSVAGVTRAGMSESPTSFGPQA